jgi:hypothetical protein
MVETRGESTGVIPATVSDGIVSDLLERKCVGCCMPGVADLGGRIHLPCQ